MRGVFSNANELKNEYFFNDIPPHELLLQVCFNLITALVHDHLHVRNITRVPFLLKVLTTWPRRLPFVGGSVAEWFRAAGAWFSNVPETFRARKAIF